jgi:hypothetical protein
VPRPFPKKISQIKPTLTNLAQTSHYLIEFGGLSANLREHLRLRGMDSRYITESIGLLCSRAALPGSGFATADVVGNYIGIAEKFAHTRTFVQMDLEFYVDNEYKSLKFLEHWMDFISSGSTTTTGGDGVSPLRDGYYYRMKYPIEYKCDETRIVKFERDYKRYIEYRFFGLFPISLNATTVSYEGSQILKASATFHYDRYVSGKSYSYDQFRKEDNNKTTPNSQGDQTSRSIYERASIDAFSGKLDLDLGISAPGGSSAGNYSRLFDTSRNFGILNNDIVTRSFVGERII